MNNDLDMDTQFSGPTQPNAPGGVGPLADEVLAFYKAVVPVAGEDNATRLTDLWLSWQMDAPNGPRFGPTAEEVAAFYGIFLGAIGHHAALTFTHRWLQGQLSSYAS